MMNDITVGIIIASMGVFLMLLVATAEHSFTERDVAKECDTYNMATIDGKVYNCTPRGDK